MEYLVSNEQDMQNLVSQVVDLLEGFGSDSTSLKTADRAMVIALNGDLGVGKTTFTKALAQHLGIREHVTSPTFVIQKSYKIPIQDIKKQNRLVFDKLVHIDAYRLESSDDTAALNFNTTLAEEHTLVVIEWAENIKNALPVGTVSINFEHESEITRKVTIDGILDHNGKRSK